MRDLFILFVQVIGSVAMTLSLGKSLGCHRKSKAYGLVVAECFGLEIWKTVLSSLI